MGVSVERVEEADRTTGDIGERQGEVTESGEGCRLSRIEDSVVDVGRQTASGIGERVKRGDLEIGRRRTSGACDRRCAIGPVEAVRTQQTWSLDRLGHVLVTALTE